MPQLEDAVVAELPCSIFLIFSADQTIQTGGRWPLAGPILPEVWDETYTRILDLTPPARDFAKMPCLLMEL
jgi:hypothetical protein